MKFQCKFIFIIVLFSIASSSIARDVILLENLATEKEGELVMQILQKKFNLPRQLITYKNRKSCTQSSEAIMHLCLKTNGELEIVRMNKYVVEETLSVFLEPEV